MILMKAMRQERPNRRGAEVNEVHQLWIGRRFRENDKGNYTVTGGCGKERVEVEIAPTFLTAGQDKDPPSALVRMHPKIREAARRKWGSGETNAVYHPFSKQLNYYLISITQDDLR
jgi:hypothetical protein